MDELRSRLARVRERFWVLPALCIAMGVAAGLVIPWLDGYVTAPERIALSGQEETARALLATIVALGVSVAGVSFSVIAVALVLASQQLSPRVLRSFQRQSLNQVVLGMLLGTATYALFVLGAVSAEQAEPVPEISVTVAMVLAALSLCLFVVFLHHAVRSLNASAVIRRIAAEGHKSIETPYPVGAGSGQSTPSADVLAERWARLPTCIEVRAPRAGYVASVDAQAILDWAASAGAVVEQRRGVGTFVVTGGVIALVRADHDEVDVGPVRDAFLLQEERVVDRDVAFPIRQLADIALKGLSPSINDPTTAENAMDSATDTLVRFAGRPPLDAVRADDDGVPRMIAIVPTLGDLVVLAFDQVRRDAASRPAFAVRLLELLADLREAAAGATATPAIDRQAALIAEQAATRADLEADRQMVRDAYARLHANQNVT